MPILPTFADEAAADRYRDVLDAPAEVVDGNEGTLARVRIGGEQVLDLWVGVAYPSTDRSYAPDTVQLVFSST